MQDAPILIAGAGIGGLTAALALGRAGLPCLLVEQRTQIEEIGAGLQLSPNASRILIELGLEPVLTRYAATPERLIVRDGTDGKTLSTLPMGVSMAQKFGAPYWSIHRADLQTVLLDAVRGLGTVRLIFGRKVSALVKNDDESLIVTCSSATQSEDVFCRALIGADGLWSNVAELIGPAKAPEFLGYQAWRGLIPIQDWPSHLPKTESRLWLGSKAHLVHYPLRRGSAINVVAVTSDAENRPGWSHPGERHKITDRFREWAPDAKDVINAVAEWSVWSLFDRPARPQWGAHRVTLLGDAAHPVLPFLAQGAALAIEDAATLTQDIIATPDDVAGALRRYEAKRRRRASQVQEAARANGRTYHLGWPLNKARNFVMARTDLSKRYDWLYSFTLN
jgi:salicylate hydroxylase